MTKQEFLELAAKQWEKLKELEDIDNFYEFEKTFDEMHIEFGRLVLEKKLGNESKDRREKKGLGPDMDK